MSQSITEALKKLSITLAQQGIAEDIVIHSEGMFERLIGEMLADPLQRDFPINPLSRLKMYGNQGMIEVTKECPATVQKLVREELNRRAMQTMKYRR